MQGWAIAQPCIYYKAEAWAWSREDNAAACTAARVWLPYGRMMCWVQPRSRACAL